CTQPTHCQHVLYIRSGTGPACRRGLSVGWLVQVRVHYQLSLSSLNGWLYLWPGDLHRSKATVQALRYLQRFRQYLPTTVACDYESGQYESADPGGRAERAGATVW